MTPPSISRSAPVTKLSLERTLVQVGKQHRFAESLAASDRLPNSSDSSHHGQLEAWSYFSVIWIV
jgi:hypothetical protein